MKISFPLNRSTLRQMVGVSYHHTARNYCWKFFFTKMNLSLCPVLLCFYVSQCLSEQRKHISPQSFPIGGILDQFLLFSSLEFYTPPFHSLLFTSVHLIPIKIVRHNCSESIFCLLLAGESETRMTPGRRNETEVLPICVEAEVLTVPRPLESKVQCLPEAPT